MVWTMKAMYAQDQLRQRVAWALSQIIVVGADDRKDEWNEKWAHFYDIFVRNAFGNFRDILGAVTYSPLMGHYLTYELNKCYDQSGTYADENYAREIMQLFTIGLEKLNSDGTPILDSDNAPIPTYGNEQIMDVARVFTGFRDPHTRENIEGWNRIDPMKMRSKDHDIYPKQDLDGNFLGDGYPLCSDLPKHHFLAVGAKYEFRGYSNPATVNVDEYEVPTTSGLFNVLCNPDGNGDCQFSLVRTLDQTVLCVGSECNIEFLRVVKVDHNNKVGYFEYVAPTCVHHFFYNGVVIQLGNWVGKDKHKVCVSPEWPIAGASCCLPNGCTNAVPPFLTKKGLNCSATDKLQCGRSGWKRTKNANWLVMKLARATTGTFAQACGRRNVFVGTNRRVGFDMQPRELCVKQKI